MERAGGGIRPTTCFDKIEEPILVRDTRIYLHTVWRLLSDPVIPLDWAEHAAYLCEEVAALQSALGDSFDLSVVAERARELGVRAAELNRLSSELPDEANAARFNAALIAVSRALVPLDYTECDRFEQDPAIAAPPYPSLRAARELANAAPGSDRFNFLLVGATPRAQPHRLGFAPGD